MNTEEASLEAQTSRPLQIHNKTLPPFQITAQPAWALGSSSTTSSATKADRNPGLVIYNELPSWYQDNSLIQTSYRPVSRSYHRCLSSWRYLHNETVNIFSHLIPAIFFIISEAWMYPYLTTYYPAAKPLDHLVIAFFLLTASICLGLSATYHTLMNHSKDVSLLFLRLDFVGILIVTWGDLISGIYMVFFCETKWRWTYWAVVTALSCITAVLLVHSKLQGPRWRSFRVAAFIGIAFFILAPLGHGIYMFSFKQMLKQSGIQYYFLEGALFIVGAFFYATRIPELYLRGKVDNFGCSHQIFHVFVVLATVVHLVGILNAFEYNYKHRQCGG